MRIINLNKVDSHDGDLCVYDIRNLVMGRYLVFQGEEGVPISYVLQRMKVVS